jgi:hypothetical protein
MSIEELMLTKAKFTKMVEETVRFKRLTYMDSIIHLCSENKIEIEDIKKYISEPIKNKLEAEAMKLNFLPRTNSLPFE